MLYEIHKRRQVMRPAMRDTPRRLGLAAWFIFMGVLLTSCGAGGENTASSIPALEAYPARLVFVADSMLATGE